MIEPAVKAVAQSLSTPAEAFSLLVTDAMVNQIVQYTNLKLDLIRPNYARPRDVLPTNTIEIRAFIGLMFLAGLRNAGHVNLNDLFREDGTGIEYFRLIMTERRLRLLLVAVRFDNVDLKDREDRLQTDKLTKIREFFDEFVNNCQRCYTLSDRITIDEMLEAFKGNCGFRQYMPKKPAKYGIKLLALADAKTYYTFNMEIYCGTQPEGPRKQSNSPTDVVMRLAEPIYQSSRCIIVDNWFTSYTLLEKLAEKKLSLIGTVRKNKTFLPKSFLKESEFSEERRAIFGFNQLATLTVYYGKNKKIVPLMSSLPDHNNDYVSHSKDGKPIIILDYNKYKGGVDAVDRLKVNYSVARTSSRWTLTLFWSVLNIAGINSHILLRLGKNEQISRKQFLMSLSRSFVYDLARLRMAETVQLPMAVRLRIDTVFPRREDDPAVQLFDPPIEGAAKGRCYLDTSTQNRSSTVRCNKCKRFICTFHRILFCTECNKLIRF